MTNISKPPKTLAPVDFDRDLTIMSWEAMLQSGIREILALRRRPPVQVTQLTQDVAYFERRNERYRRALKAMGVADMEIDIVERQSFDALSL